LVPERLADPINWGKSKHIFVNSMSDLFHEDIPEHYIKSVFDVMQTANWHIFQVLTKRADRLHQLCNSILNENVKSDHIWVGVSVENRKYGIPRIEQLRESNAAMKFLSVEPLIEELGEIDLEGIDWVIVGGESGPGARKIEEEWVVNIREQCFSSGTPFFFKQWGGVRKKENGRALQGQTFDEMPKFEPVDAPAKEIRSQFIHALQLSIKSRPILLMDKRKNRKIKAVKCVA